jgi:hypothetical protein
MSETERSIELVKIHLVLYDLANKNHRYVRRIDNVRAEVGVELGQEGECELVFQRVL